MRNLNRKHQTPVKLRSDDESDASKRFAESASVYLTNAVSALPVLKEACHTASS